MSRLMLLAPCGADCKGCEYAEKCGGSCYACQGKPFYVKEFGFEVCAIYDCSVNKKGYKSCAQCQELPCQTFYDWRDPNMTDEAFEQSVNERVKTLKASVSAS